MIPLMMQKDYKPKGWRKSLYYRHDFRFYGIIVMP